MTRQSAFPFPLPFEKVDANSYKSTEELRLQEDKDRKKYWKQWGPYLSERQWSTVREDYSANGDAWNYFPHDFARAKAYRWGEDGLAGYSDTHARICFSLGLWNMKDPILKERLFGMTSHDGNHGEDVKEVYYYLDSTPTHSYMKYLYKYPQDEYPYERLTEESKSRDRTAEEFEILDTGLFQSGKYWDVFVEYAKDAEDPRVTNIRISAYNRGDAPASLVVLPQLCLRNTWSWGLPGSDAKPSVCEDNGSVKITEPHFDHDMFLQFAQGHIDQDTFVRPELIFTENESNLERLYPNSENKYKYCKDAFHDYVIGSHRQKSACAISRDNETRDPVEDASSFVNPDKTGTKAAGVYTFTDVPSGSCATVYIRLGPQIANEFPQNVESIVDARKGECDEFYDRFRSGPMPDDEYNIMRQALSGMLWNKQFYHFIQKQWIQGDPTQVPPPESRHDVRNQDWSHLYIEDILSMPDKWEYPFFAIWDSAFHTIPLAMVDPEFAKKQLDVMTREWYMHPNGALPAYEWNFSDVNPPVHAWAMFRVFKLERKMHGHADLQFLERVFQKLLLNFTWWVNRKDVGSSNLFQGGFLGLDNISPFNRSEPLPTGGVLRQADGTGWMAFYCLNMLNVALELAKHNPVYEDIASKFFEHFIHIADAVTFDASQNNNLWDESKGFYFDSIYWGPGNTMAIPAFSMVGLIPLYATLVLEHGTINRFPGFKKRMEWFIENRHVLAERNMANMKLRGTDERRLLALASADRLRRILDRMLNPEEFLSEFGVRTLSKYHQEHPWSMDVGDETYSLEYWPGDSLSGMFGGNSNWRGPIWICVTFLIVESLHRFYQFYGSNLKVECPKGSGVMGDLAFVANDIQKRIINLFVRDAEGRRACNGCSDLLDFDPHFKDYMNFHEFFHADSGKGHGASHQCGWTGLIAFIIWQAGQSARKPRTPRAAASHFLDEHIGKPVQGSGYFAPESSWKEPVYSPDDL